MEQQPEIVTFPHPILLAKAQAVTNIDQTIRDILDAMTLTMINNSGIGLAAPQIGISQRLISVYVSSRLYQVINPEITWQSGTSLDLEGCLSLPDQLFEVSRVKEVVIQGIKPDEKEVCLLANGLLARVFQHEIDHLDGILINSIGKRFIPQGSRAMQIKNEKIIG